MIRSKLRCAQFAIWGVLSPSLMAGAGCSASHTDNPTAPAAAHRYTSSEMLGPAGSQLTSDTQSGAVMKSKASSTPTLPQSPFIARLRKPMAVTSMRVSARVLVVDNCLIADFDSGGRATLVLPPQARVEGSTRKLTAIRINSTRIPLGGDQALPGGGANVRARDLVSPVPARCPNTLFVIGG